MLLSEILSVENEKRNLIAQELYIRYKNKMYTIAYAHLHNRYDAEDAVSEAFIHIIKHIEKFKDPASNATLGLIYVITHRCAIKIFNKNKPIIDVLEEEIDYYAEHFE